MARSCNAQLEVEWHLRTTKQHAHVNAASSSASEYVSSQQVRESDLMARELL
jgi:hypothetical protein